LTARAFATLPAGGRAASADRRGTILDAAFLDLALGALGFFLATFAVGFFFVDFLGTRAAIETPHNDNLHGLRQPVVDSKSCALILIDPGYG
jgi:hypothetical protein